MFLLRPMSLVPVGQTPLSLFQEVVVGAQRPQQPLPLQGGGQNACVPPCEHQG